jgi:hypothetical protein
MLLIWRAAVSFFAVALLLSVQLTTASPRRGRRLEQENEGPQLVSTAEELLEAIINRIDNIRFTDNITLPESMFPGADSPAVAEAARLH